MNKEKEEFSYCIGRPWDPKNPDVICVYAHGSQVYHGSWDDANAFKNYVDRQEPDKEHFIYKLVKADTPAGKK